METLLTQSGSDILEYGSGAPYESVISPAAPDMFGGLLSMVASFVSVLFFPVFIIMLALVLYYFTGEKKKADGFMPMLMAQGLRIYTYVWLFVISVVGYLGLNSVLVSILDVVLPEQKSSFFRGSSSNDFESEVFVKGILLLLLMAALAGGKVFLNRKAVAISKVGATVSAKLFLVTGLVVFSVMAFISTLMSLDSLVSYLYESDKGLSAASFAGMFASITFLAVYMVKAWDTLKKESK